MEGYVMKKMKKLILHAAAISVFAPALYMHAMDNRGVPAAVGLVEQAQDMRMRTEEILEAQNDKIREMHFNMWIRLYGIDARNDDGETLFTIAHDRGDEELKQMLLRAGATSCDSWLDREFASAISQQKRRGWVKTLELANQFLAMGANVNSVDEKGISMLMLAIENEASELVEALLKAGARCDSKNKEGNTILMRTLIGGSDIKLSRNDEARDYYRVGMRDGHDCLPGVKAHRKEEYKKIVKYLIQYGADVNAVNADGYTALMYAVMLDYDMSVLTMIVKRCLPKTIDMLHWDIYETGTGFQAYGIMVLPTRGLDQFTPLMCALWKGKMGIAALLIEAGADITVKNDKGRTALDCVRGDDENCKIVKKLLREKRLVLEYLEQQDYILTDESTLRVLPLAFSAMPQVMLELIASYNVNVTGGKLVESSPVDSRYNNPDFINMAKKEIAHRILKRIAAEREVVGAGSIALGSVASSSMVSSSVACRQCTYINNEQARNCEMCTAPLVAEASPGLEREMQNKDGNTAVVLHENACALAVGSDSREAEALSLSAGSGRRNSCAHSEDNGFVGYLSEEDLEEWDAGEKEGAAGEDDELWEEN